MAHRYKWIMRGYFTLAVVCLAMVGNASARTADLPTQPDELVASIRQAIETRDYEQLKELVFWKDVGKIKKRIVRFQLNRNLGRPIKSITFDDLPEDGFNEMEATGKLALNMPVTDRVTVVFDEPPINDAGKLPTSVFVVGKKDGHYRIAVVVRTGFDDDDDD